MRILVVDDEEMKRRSLAEDLTSWGHEVTACADGLEAATQLARALFDVVIADLKMPRMGGIEFIREVKKIDRDAVVMVITGFADLSTAVETINLGAYDYVEKPVEVEKFRAALERGLEKKHLLSKLRFAKGAIWTISISIPLWLILGIILAYFWKK